MIRAGAVVAVMAAAAGCGDDLVHEDQFTATSGARLMLQWYGYDDGTRQPVSDEFFDRILHTRCRPQPWTDEVVRCVPIADEVVYADAACSQRLGRDPRPGRPTHFLGYQRIGGDQVATHVYRAGAKATAITSYYQEQDGVCVGPFAETQTVDYYEIDGELMPWDLVAIHDDELDLGRLGLKVRRSDDGLVVPVGLRDRELEIACVPTAAPGGGDRQVCEPVEAGAATLFRDPGCETPVVAVADTTKPPAVVRVIEASGCPSYHAIAGPVSPPLYRRDGDVCRAAGVTPGQHTFGLGPAIELPALDRRIEAVPGHRLQRIVLADGDLRFASDRLYDTAIRAECERHAFGEVIRCIPARTAAATTLYGPGCAVEVLVAELPQHMCARPGFAVAFTDDADGLALHAIGDPVTTAVYRFDGSQCRAYGAAAGNDLYRLGPKIDPTAFVRAVYFGER